MFNRIRTLLRSRGWRRGVPLRAAVAFVIAQVLPWPALAQQASRDTTTSDRLPPLVRPAPLDPALNAFLDRLTTIVRRRDADGLLEIVVEDIPVGFADAHGRATFAKTWAIASPSSPFWRDIEWLLSFSRRYVQAGDDCLPYVHNRLPGGYSLDHAVVIAAREPLRATPSASGRILATLSYDIVERDQSIERPYDRAHQTTPLEPEPGLWSKVKLQDGRRGYVRARSLWAVGGPRLCFALIDGQWRISAYAVGD